MTAHSIAALLKIEMEPWQEFVLTAMLREYRRPDPPEVEAAVVGIEYGPPWCGAGHPSGRNFFCAKKSGHSGSHYARNVGTWQPEVEVRLPDRPTCGARHPSTTSAPTCARPAGHEEQSHEASGGFHWPV